MALMKLLTACSHTSGLFIVPRRHSRVPLESDDMPRALWSVWQILFDVCVIYGLDTGFPSLPDPPSVHTQHRMLLKEPFAEGAYKYKIIYTADKMCLRTGLIKHSHSIEWGNVWGSTLRTVKPGVEVSFHNYCCYRKPWFYILLFCFPLTLNSKSK